MFSDLLMLRCLAVASSSFAIAYNFFHPHGRILWLYVGWHALYMSVNIVYSLHIYWDRNPIIDAPGMSVYNAHFKDIVEKREFAALYSEAALRTVADKKSETII